MAKHRLAVATWGVPPARPATRCCGTIWRCRLQARLRREGIPMLVAAIPLQA